MTATKSKKGPATYTAEIYRLSVYDNDPEGSTAPVFTFQGKVHLGGEAIGWTKPAPAGGGAMLASIAIAEAHRGGRGLVCGADPGPGAELTGATELAHLMSISKQEVNAQEADRRERFAERHAAEEERHVRERKQIAAEKNAISRPDRRGRNAAALSS